MLNWVWLNVTFNDIPAIKRQGRCPVFKRPAAGYPTQLAATGIFGIKPIKQGHLDVRRGL